MEIWKFYISRSRRKKRLSNKVATLPGFEGVAKVALPPLISFIQVVDLYLVSVGVLRKPVAKCEVAVKAHKFAEINIGNPRVASNDEHVLVVIRGGRFAKICGAGNYKRISS